MRENTFNYEIKVLPENNHQLFELFRKDVVSFFTEYEIEVENRKAICLVLTSTGTNENLKSKGGKWKVEKGRFGYKSTNSTIDDFIMDLTFYFFQQGPILVNEANIPFNIDLDLEVNNFTDLDELNSQLAKYNLKFEEKETFAEHLIIKDK